MRILIDVNVALDVLLKRAPWAAEAQQIWDAVATDRVEGYLAPTTITTVFYLTRKLPGGSPEGLRAVLGCLQTFEICSMDRSTLESAALMTGSDSEDNVQIACAQQTSVDGIVTRNPAHFTGATCRVYSPAELLATLP